MYLTLVISLLAEVTYIYPLYLLINSGMIITIPQPSSDLVLLPVGLIVVLALSTLTVNAVLKRQSYRLFTVCLVNLILFVSSIFALVKIWGLLNTLNLWLSTLTILWIEARAILITRQNTDSNQSIRRFELGLGILLSIYLLSALAGISLPGGLVWLFLSYCLNTFALALSRKNQTPEQPIWLGPGLLMMVLIPLTVLFSWVLPKLSNPVGEALAASFPLLKILRDLFLAPLIGLLRLGHVIPKQRITQDMSIPQQEVIVPVESAKTGLDQVLQLLFWILIMLLVLAVFLLIVYILVCTMRYLWSTRTQSSSPNSNRVTFYSTIRDVLRGIRLWYVRFALYVRFLFPYPSKLSIAQAYQALLSWGKKRRYPRLSFETPDEYCKRLGVLFPQQSQNLELITKAYVWYFFGERQESSCSNHEQLRLYEAVRSLYR